MTQHTAPLAIAFDVDETLVSTGGAGARSWARGFDKLWGVTADIGKFTKGGMTDPEVGRAMDIAAAHAADAVGVGVATGKYTVDQLRQAGADHVLADLTAPFPGWVAPGEQ
jgi:phosphoglycolate phosphatase-like HAD superfamily hydrolase